MRERSRYHRGNKKETRKIKIEQEGTYDDEGRRRDRGRAATGLRDKGKLSSLAADTGSSLATWLSPLPLLPIHPSPSFLSSLTPFLSFSPSVISHTLPLSFIPSLAPSPCPPHHSSFASLPPFPHPANNADNNNGSPLRMSSAGSRAKTGNDP